MLMKVYEMFYTSSRDGAMRINFVVSHKIAKQTPKHSMSFSDWEFIKECVVDCCANMHWDKKKHLRSLLLQFTSQGKL